MFLYAASQYHLDKQIGDTVYFLSKSEMQDYLKKQNKKQEDIYRGRVLDPLLPLGSVKNSNKIIVNSFEEFKELLKPQYRFLAMDLYNSIKM